jgi:DNA/RNA-binding domain of Phe-tRNA-synthetase-like protein
MRCSIAEIAGEFPETRIAFVLAEDLRLTTDRPAGLDTAIGAAEARCRERYAGRELASIPEIQDWRQAYKGFGVKKTSYRSSVERLVKNVLAERTLPRVNSLVDSYNLISLAYLVPVGADDLAQVAGEVSFRPSRPDDTFIALGREEAGDDPPKPGEIVYADEAKVLCRRWNWYQDARSPVTLATSSAIVTVQAQGTADVEAAAKALCQLLAEHCGARASFALADTASPEVTL